MPRTPRDMHRTTALAYAKGSPMLAEYLRLNNIVSIDIHADDTRRVWESSPSGSGFPRDFKYVRDAQAFARHMAGHCGLPLNLSRTL